MRRTPTVQGQTKDEFYRTGLSLNPAMTRAEFNAMWLDHMIGRRQLARRGRTH